MTLWTAGHGKRAAEELVALLDAASIGLLVDVRRYPVSRRNPQFSRDRLEASLLAHGVSYQWWGDALGGRRSPASHATRHPAWTDTAFRAYADHMDRPEFRHVFSHLLALAADQRTVILCAETRWEQCHRRLLSDAAALAGTPVTHLIAPGRAEGHRLHPALRRGEDGWPVYDLGAPPELG